MTIRFVGHDTLGQLSPRYAGHAAGDEGVPPQGWLQAWAHGVPVAALSDPGGVIAGKGLGVVAASPTRLFDAVRALRAYLAAFECARQRHRMPLHA